jgi:hypothetical protein
MVTNRRDSENARIGEDTSGVFALDLRCEIEQDER